MKPHRTPFSTRHLARRSAATLLTLCAALLATPAVAQAHGPLDPEASTDLAHVIRTPPGVTAHVVDGYQRLWMSVARGRELTVLDYVGAPYLRFDDAGVQVNENSAMYYLNQTPPNTPPPTLTANTAPSWHQVSSGRSYEWHDGRIGALASTMIEPGTTYLGHWTIRIKFNGVPTQLVGEIYHATTPSLAWLWPIAVALLCLPALLRLRDRTLERRVCRAVAWVALFGAALLAVGAGFHGRPGLSATLLALMVVELSLQAYAALRLLRGQDGPLTFALIALLAGYRGVAGITILWRGFVLLALPGTLARLAVTLCLAGSLSLTLIVFSHTDYRTDPEPA